MSLTATLRAEGRLPVGTIRWYLETFHRLHVSVRAIIGAIRQMARRGMAMAVAMVAMALGDDFAGVLVSDFYVGYAPHDGVKQKCWAHVLRDVHDLRVAHPGDATVQAWAAGVHDLYRQATAWKAASSAAHTAERQRMAERFARQLTAVYGPYIGVATAAQRVLSERMAKYLHELFVFVVEPAVPADNNRAERSLRHLVTSRNAAQGAPGGRE